MAGQVEVQPAVAERLAPGGWRCSGTAITSTPPGSSSRAASRIASPGRGQVLERVPEDDGRPVPSPSISLERLVAEVRRARLALEAHAPRARVARSASSRVPSPAPTSSTGPAGAISSSRPRAGRACGAGARRRPNGKRRPDPRPVPVAVGARRARPRSGQGSVVAAPQRRAAGAARAGGRPGVERAPRTRRRSAGRCRLTARHAPRSGRGRPRRGRAPRRGRSARSSKSSGVIASARGSSSRR